MNGLSPLKNRNTDEFQTSVFAVTKRGEHLQGGQPRVPVVKEDTGYGVRLQVMIKADVNRVFQALTTGDQVVVWDYPDQVRLDPRKNGWIRISSGGVEREGKILAFTPPSVFAYAITTPFPAPDRNKFFKALIHYILEDVFNQTRVRLRHAGFPTEQFATLEERAWKGIYLPRLREYCESVKVD